MRDLSRGDRKARPCPWCAKSLPVDAERCDACQRRLRPVGNPLTLPTATDITISERATQGLGRRE